jgi:hypothetical protein
MSPQNGHTRCGANSSLRGLMRNNFFTKAGNSRIREKSGKSASIIAETPRVGRCRPEPSVLPLGFRIRTFSGGDCANKHMPWTARKWTSLPGRVGAPSRRIDGVGTSDSVVPDNRFADNSGALFCIVPPREGRHHSCDARSSENLCTSEQLSCRRTTRM